MAQEARDHSYFRTWKCCEQSASRLVPGAERAGDEARPGAYLGGRVRISELSVVHGLSLLGVCWSRQGILAVSWLSVLLQSLCISYQGWTIAHKDVKYHVCAKNCFRHFTLSPLRAPLACSQRYKDTELLRNTCGHSEELVHVSVTWCRCVLMDGTFTGLCGCQSQIMPESCLGYMLLVRCFFT